jgi:nicotinamidase-related amidase
VELFIENWEKTMSNSDNRLSPENAAILFVDNQTGLLSNVQTVEPTLLKNNTLALAALAKVYDLPVVLTTSDSGGPNGPLLSELVEMYPENEVINRTKICAWDDDNFVNAVKATGRTHLIICGIVTDVCVAFPAIAAQQDGYQSYAVVDASGTWTKLIEDASLHRMSQAGVITTNWAAVGAELQRDWALPTGQGLGGVFAQYLPAYRFIIESRGAR